MDTKKNEKNLGNIFKKRFGLTCFSCNKLKTLDFLILYLSAKLKDAKIINIKPIRIPIEVISFECRTRNSKKGTSRCSP